MSNLMRYYLAAIALFIAMKWAYTQADTIHLLWLLRPVGWLVGVFTGAPYERIADTGAYTYPTLGIVIEKSCSGFHFWLLCAWMLFVQLLAISHSARQKTASFFCAFAAAYALTILINSSRIYASIVFQAQIAEHTGIEKEMAHQAIGIAVYLTVLIAVYLTIETTLKNKTSYAKPA